MTLAVLATLAACSTPPQPPEKNAAIPPDRALDIRLKVVDAVRPLEGDIIKIGLKIKNRSGYFVFLKELGTVGGGPAVVWQKSRFGSLKWDNLTDEYVYRRVEAGDETLPIFNNGLLVPRRTYGVAECSKCRRPVPCSLQAPKVQCPRCERDVTSTRREQTFEAEEEVTVLVRLLKLPKVLRVVYYSMTAEEVAKDVYFPTINEHANNPNHPDFGMTKFKKPPLDFLERYTEYRHYGRFEASMERDHYVYPAGHHLSFRPTERETLVPIDLHVQPRPFSVADAGKKAGVQPIDYTFCSLINSWILDSGKGMLLVNERGSWPIPETDFQVFMNADTSRDFIELEFQRETHLLFDQKYHIVSSVSQRGRVYLLMLPFDKFADFLKDAGEFSGICIKARPHGGLLVTRKK